MYFQNQQSSIPLFSNINMPFDLRLFFNYIFRTYMRLEDAKRTLVYTQCIIIHTASKLPADRVSIFSFLYRFSLRQLLTWFQGYTTSKYCTFRNKYSHFHVLCVTWWQGHLLQWVLGACLKESKNSLVFTYHLLTPFCIYLHRKQIRFDKCIKIALKMWFSLILLGSLVGNVLTSLYSYHNICVDL